LLLIAHADIRFTSAESEQPETRTYNYARRSYRCISDN